MGDDRLKQILGFDEETGAYARPNLLRRMAQWHICFDRQISNAELADELGVSREYVRQYFAGDYPRTHKAGSGVVSLRTIDARYPNDGEEKSRRRLSRFSKVGRCRRFEDEVERALEAISARRDLSPPPVIGTPEEHYLQREVLLPRLMKAPTQTSRTKELI